MYHRLPSTGTKLQICIWWLKNALKPNIISAGRNRQSVLQMDSWRSLWSYSILTSPSPLCWEMDPKQEADSMKTGVDLWPRGKCDWTRPFPIWTRSHCTEIYDEDDTVDYSWLLRRIGHRPALWMLSVLCLWMSREPQSLRFVCRLTWSSSNPHNSSTLMGRGSCCGK